MTQPGRKENQHYVPKMLLRNFSIEEGAKRGHEQVHVLDKSNSRTFIANIRNVAAAFDFYEAEMAGQVVNAEAILSELEGRASTAMQKIFETETVAVLEAEERMWLSIFCSVQFVRTQTVRNRIEAMNGGMEAHIRRMGYDPAEVEGFQRMSEDDIKAMAIRWIASAVNEYPKYLSEKVWFLMKAEGDLEFLIGDHPVVLHNDRRFGPYGNLGLAVPGIQIYLPLSPRLALAMWCPSILAQIEQDQREPRRLRTQGNRAQRRAAMARAGSELRELERKVALAEKLLAAAETAGCLLSNEDNTTMLNSLQVENASRFLMSRSGDFALAERMFADNPMFRSRAGDGLRIA